MKTTQLFGLSIVRQKKIEVVSDLKLHLKSGNKLWLVATPNPEQIMLSRRDERFWADLKQMDWLLPDGVGLVWASHLLNDCEKQIEERITGLDLVQRLIQMAKELGRPVLIVGGRDYQGRHIDLSHDAKTKNNIANFEKQSKARSISHGEAELVDIVNQDETYEASQQVFGNSDSHKVDIPQKEKEEIGKEDPGWLGENFVKTDIEVVIRSAELLKNGDLNQEKIQGEFGVWWCQGYEDVSAPTKEEDEWLDEVMARLKPVAIFVALGAPHQEKWLVKRRAFLSAYAVHVGLTVGGAFDVLTGQLPRAPQSWQNLGLEWLWRLIQEPHRWRRQLALIKFVGLVIKTKLTLP